MPIRWKALVMKRRTAGFSSGQRSFSIAERDPEISRKLMTSTLASASLTNARARCWEVGYRLGDVLI
jgi:hypothetical protein